MECRNEPRTCFFSHPLVPVPLQMTQTEAQITGQETNVSDSESRLSDDVITTNSSIDKSMI